MSETYCVSFSKSEIETINFILKEFVRFDGFFKDIKYSSFSGIFRFSEFKKENKQELLSIKDKLKKTGMCDE
jgi:hypothetical protein